MEDGSRRDNSVGASCEKVRHCTGCPSQHDSQTSSEGAFEIPELHSLFEVRTCTMKAAVAV